MKDHSILTDKEHKTYGFIEKYSQKYGKYPFCFYVSRPTMSGAMVVPEMDLAAVLPHNKRGRPLAGIRHDIVLRAKNTAECQRWKQALTQCVKTCQQCC